MSWICWLGMLQAGACPPCLPAGGGASLSQEWRGSPSAWAERVVHRHGMGAALRGIVPVDPWDTTETPYFVRTEQQVFYVGNFAMAHGASVVVESVRRISPLYSTEAICWFDPALHVVIREAEAIHRSDLPGEVKGRELGKLIRPGMTWDEVRALLGAREARAAILIPGRASRSRTRLLCPSLRLCIAFHFDSAQEVQPDEASVTLWDLASDPEPGDVFNFFPGWSR